MNVLVLGANGLIGHRVVNDLCSRDFQVIAADLEFTRVPNEVARYEVDISNPASLADLFAAIAELPDPLTGAVNLAYPRNSEYGKHLFDVSYESFCENVSLHLGGYFEFTKLMAIYCKTHSIPLSLVNISSIYGVAAPKFEIYEGTNMTVPVEYAAIKSALIHLNKYFAAYMKGTGFRVNSISPGGIFDSQPESFVLRYREHCLSKGLLDAGDLLGSIRFLLGPESQYINGQNLILDDGFTL